MKWTIPHEGPRHSTTHIEQTFQTLLNMRNVAMNVRWAKNREQPTCRSYLALSNSKNSVREYVTELVVAKHWFREIFNRKIFSFHEGIVGTRESKSYYVLGVEKIQKINGVDEALKAYCACPYDIHGSFEMRNEIIYLVNFADEWSFGYCQDFARDKIVAKYEKILNGDGV